MDINIVLSVISKETPINPKRKDWIYRCPICEGYIGIIGCKEIERCKHCFQKLNWKHVM